MTAAAGNCAPGEPPPIPDPLPVMKFVSTLKQLLGRRARRARLDEEMRHHLELLTEENVQRGLDRGEARRQAHVAFGNVLATR